MKKRVFACLLSVVMLLTFAACQKKAATSAPVAEATKEPAPVVTEKPAPAATPEPAPEPEPEPEPETPKEIVILRNLTMS